MQSAPSLCTHWSPGDMAVPPDDMTSAHKFLWMSASHFMTLWKEHWCHPRTRYWRVVLRMSTLLFMMKNVKVNNQYCSTSAKRNWESREVVNVSNIKPEDRYRSQVLLKLVNSQEYRSTVSCQQTARRGVQLFASVNVTLHVPLERSAVESANSVTSEAGLEQSFRETTRLPMEAFAVNSERETRDKTETETKRHFAARVRPSSLCGCKRHTFVLFRREKCRVAAKLRAT